jgi:hypothetical protein
MLICGDNKESQFVLNDPTRPNYATLQRIKRFFNQQKERVRSKSVDSLTSQQRKNKEKRKSY